MPDRLTYRVKAGMLLEAALIASTARSVYGSDPRNGRFRGYCTSTAREGSKTQISSNRGENGGMPESTSQESRWNEMAKSEFIWDFSFLDGNNETSR